MDEREILKPESICYNGLVFLSVILSESKCKFVFGLSSNSCNPLWILFIHLAFLFCSFFVHILHQNSLVYFTSSSQCLVLFVRLDTLLIPLRPSSFTYIFWFISHNFVVGFVRSCLFGFFSFHLVNIVIIIIIILLLLLNFLQVLHTSIIW